MKKILKYIICAGVAALAMACTREPAELELPAIAGQTDDKGVTIQLQFPDMGVGTRSLENGKLLELVDLDLFLFIFDGGNLLQTIHIEPNTDKTKRIDERTISFKTELPQTDNAPVIHIIAIDDTEGDFDRRVEQVGYGIEDTVMPAFTAIDGKDAYWARIELPAAIKIVPKEDGDDSDGSQSDTQTQESKDTSEEIKNFFNDNTIYLVRNFAKVSVIVHPDYENDVNSAFELKGFMVVNQMDGGSIAPWYISNDGDVDYAKFVETDKESPEYGKPFKYDDLDAQGFTGVTVQGSKITNKAEDLSEDNSDGEDETRWGLKDKYVYERRAANSSPLYVIIYGYYKYGNNNTPKKCYYKVDLGETDGETGLFSYYNIYRNFAYTVRITKVSSEGHDNPRFAASKPASNNLSNDVETRNMLNVSDGKEKLQVNTTKFIVTKAGEELSFRYRYYTDIRSNIPVNSEVQYSFRKSDGSFEGLPNPQDGGDVINRWTDPVTWEEDGTWNEIKIYPKDPTDELKQQSFTIFSTPNPDRDGLARTVELVLRNPWDFVNVQTYPGHWSDTDQYPNYNPDLTPGDETQLGKYFVSAQKGAPLTIFFELPAGLPEVLFPLDVTFESNRQNIENAAIGNAVVSSGASFFDGVSDMRTKFTKTIKWNEYAPDGESTKESRIQRARFITTSDVNKMSDEEITSTIVVYNEYFNKAYDKFTRNAFAPDIWDFSADEWTPIWEAGSISNTSKSAYGLTLTSTSGTNGRSITPGGTEGERYFSMARNDDTYMTFSEGYVKNVAHTATLRITASGNPVTVTCTGTGGTPTVTAPNPNFGTAKETKDWTITIPVAVSTVNITIKPTSNNSTVNIYKIEYYPDASMLPQP